MRPDIESQFSATYNDLQDLIDEHGWTEGNDRFIERHGENVWTTMQGLSYSVSPGSSAVTADGWRWMREHPELQTKYEDVAGMFAPSEGDFDYDAYLASFAEGDRESLTPEEWLKVGNDLLARRKLDEARSLLLEQAEADGRTALNDEERQTIDDLQAALAEDYHGYNFGRPIKGKGSRVTTETMIVQLEGIVDEDAVRDTPAAQATARYLEARDLMQAQVDRRRAAGETTAQGFQTAKSTRQERDTLREMADSLMEEYPEFERVWDRILRFELLPIEEEVEDDGEF